MSIIHPRILFKILAIERKMDNKIVSLRHRDI